MHTEMAEIKIMKKNRWQSYLILYSKVFKFLIWEYLTIITGKRGWKFGNDTFVRTVTMLNLIWNLIHPQKPYTNISTFFIRMSP